MNEKNEMKLLHDENEKIKPHADEKDKINLLKLKVEFLAKQKNYLKNEINRKQDLLD